MVPTNGKSFKMSLKKKERPAKLMFVNLLRASTVMKDVNKIFD